MSIFFQKGGFMRENDGMHNAYEFVINTVLRIHHFSKFLTNMKGVGNEE